jgi:hypothetical protein
LKTHKNATHERKTNSLALCKKALSAAMDVLEGTSHQTRPKIDVGDGTLLMGSIYKTIDGAQNIRSRIAPQQKPPGFMAAL